MSLGECRCVVTLPAVTGGLPPGLPQGLSEGLPQGVPPQRLPQGLRVWSGKEEEEGGGRPRLPVRPLPGRWLPRGG